MHAEEGSGVRLMPMPAFASPCEEQAIERPPPETTQTLAWGPTTAQLKATARWLACM